MADYKWRPIEPLTDQDRAIDLAEIRPLYDSWRASKKRLQSAGEATLWGFTERLIRRLSIETGILERLYDLDRGTTEALIAKGFVEDLVSRSSTDIEPSRLIDILRDQEAAIQLLMDCVGGDRQPTKGVIHELHTMLTRHQDTTWALDQFGNRGEIELLKGRYKKLPNNPRRPDGSLHEYCPPVQVDSEMENLLSWLSDYSSDDPIIVCAWLHHRFTQIHPYQDGNGRVARSLITFILLRSELLPLVVDRDLRTEYINALEEADRGDLSALARQFAGLERAAILQALSVDAGSEMEHERALTSAVIDSLTQKLGRRRQAKQAELRRVNDVAVALRGRAKDHTDRAFNKLERALVGIGEPSILVTEGDPDQGNAHWYKYEVFKSANEPRRSANEPRKFVNFAEPHYFIKFSMHVSHERLEFVVSFHHVGRELSGIMEATAFARLKSYGDSDDSEYPSQEFFLCSLEPFVFTHETNEQHIEDAFSRWLDTALALAIKEYGDRL